jgi:hypothetical protein
MAWKKFSDDEVLTMMVMYSMGKCSREIAKTLGRNPKVVQSWAKRHNWTRPKQGGAYGAWNGSYHSGCRTDRYGYREVLCPGHPFARKSGYIAEHRLVMEQHLGRLLSPKEVVHHIDGDPSNNAIENLELFPDNASHLKAELAGHVPNWTPEGRSRIGIRKN